MTIVCLKGEQSLYMKKAYSSHESIQGYAFQMVCTKYCSFSLLRHTISSIYSRPWSKCSISWRPLSGLPVSICQHPPIRTSTFKYSFSLCSVSTQFFSPLRAFPSFLNDCDRNSNMWNQGNEAISELDFIKWGPYY